MDWFDVLPVAVFLAVIPALVWLALRTQRRWRALGEALGYQPAGPPPGHAWLPDQRALLGAHGPWRVQVRLFHTGSGRSEETWTALELPLPGADPTFHLRVTREGMAAKVAKAFGGQDVVVGSPDFDAAFRVEGSDEARACGALGPGAQLALLGLERRGEVRVEAGVAFDHGVVVPVRQPDAARFLLGKVLEHRSRGAAKEELQRFQERLAAPDTALLRLVWSGAVTDPERVRAALPALAALADSVTAAAPRR